MKVWYAVGELSCELLGLLYTTYPWVTPWSRPTCPNHPISWSPSSSVLGPCAEPLNLADTEQSPTRYCPRSGSWRSNRYLWRCQEAHWAGEHHYVLRHAEIAFWNLLSPSWTDGGLPSFAAFADSISAASAKSAIVSSRSRGGSLDRTAIDSYAG